MSPSSTAASPGALVRFAATNIASYFLDTEKLSVIRGGSEDLDELARTIESAVLGKKNREGIYANASELLFFTADPADGPALCKEIERCVRETLPYATGIAVCADWTPGTPVGPVVAFLDTQLRRAQLARPTVVPGPSLSGTRACDYDGVRPAEERLVEAPEVPKPWVSKFTRRRHQRGRELRKGHVRRIFGSEIDALDTKEWAVSFDDLTGFNSAEGTAPDVPTAASVLGKICVLEVDGNKFGSVRGRLDSVESIRLFASLVQRAMEELLGVALGPLWARAPSARALPFHILKLAGDESSLVLPAAHGFEVARVLLEGFSETFDRMLDAAAAQASAAVASVRNAIGTNRYLTLAIGAVFCDSHEPIARVKQVAEHLLLRAKDSLPPDGDGDLVAGNVIDFIVNESGYLERSLAAYDERVRLRWSNDGGSGRPFDRASFATLRREIRGLRNAGFPTSRVHALVRALRESPDETRAQIEIARIFRRLPSAVLDHPELPPGLVVVRAQDVHPAHPAVGWWFDRKEAWDYVR